MGFRLSSYPVVVLQFLFRGPDPSPSLTFRSILKILAIANNLVQPDQNQIGPESFLQV